MNKELFEFQKELDELTVENGRLDKMSSELADKEQSLDWLKERKKSYLKVIMETMLIQNKISCPRAEIRATASKDYQDFLQVYKQAIEDYTKTKYKYETLLNRSKALITFISLEKEKMRVR